jgi:hypothetical protein
MMEPAASHVGTTRSGFAICCCGEIAPDKLAIQRNADAF